MEASKGTLWTPEIGNHEYHEDLCELEDLQVEMVQWISGLPW